MKNLMKKGSLFFIAFILCIGLVLSTGFTGTFASAQAEEFVDNKTFSQQDLDASSVSDLNNGGNYYYSRGIEPKFTIRDIDGNISISDKVILSFEDELVIIPDFDFYRIVDENDETMYYQADTAAVEDECSPFAYIGIFLPSSISRVEDVVMYVQYGVEETLILNNVKIVLDDSKFDYFDSLSAYKVLGNDELSQRLKASAKIYQYGAYEEEIIEETLQMQPKALSYISPNSYDNYTNTDGIIHRYVSDYFAKGSSDDFTITDDPIVQIVPKDLCFVPGEHLYIGKEYGFFIKVVTDRTNKKDYAVDILVFDICSTVPKFPSNTTGSTRITPLFQYRYLAADKTKNENWGAFDPKLTRIVTAHTEYKLAEYYMNNVGFRHTLFNPTLLNPGDPGYDAYEDDGAFIIQMRHNSRGVGLKKKGGSFVHDTIVFGLGFVPYVSYAANIYSYVYNLSNGFGSNGTYSYSRQEVIADNEVNIDTYETNNTDQIRVRGNLIKSETATQNCDGTSPRLIHVGGGYAESKYVVARRSGSTYDKINVMTSVSANIVEDNTSRWWLFGWHEGGTITDYGRATGTYERSNYQRIEDISVSGANSLYITAGSEHKTMKFIPSISGRYRFETTSSSGDPNFSVTNATTKITYSATDDIDGANNRNARLDMNLQAGQVYYIEAFSYNSNYGYNLRIGYLPEASTTITRDTAVSCFVAKDAYQMYKFVPQTSGNYDIFTSERTGDPYLFLFDSNGNKLKEDDDGLGNLNSLITYYLSSNNTYYIAVKGYNGNVVDCKLKVTPSIINRGSISLNQSFNVTVGSYTNVYEFIAPYTDRFDFYTYDKTSGDPYLELYDANRNKLTYNDDGNGDRNSLMTYNLVAGQKYYIHARSYNTNSTSYKLNVRLSTAERTDIYTSLSVSAIVENSPNQVKVYKFTAAESRYYTAYTNNVVSGDPFLELMSSTGTILATDNNGAGGINAKINFFLNAGESVYLIARGNDKGIENKFNLIIN